MMVAWDLSSKRALDVAYENTWAQYYKPAARTIGQAWIAAKNAGGTPTNTPWQFDFVTTPDQLESLLKIRSRVHAPPGGASTPAATTIDEVLELVQSGGKRGNDFLVDGKVVETPPELAGGQADFRVVAPIEQLKALRTRVWAGKREDPTGTNAGAYAILTQIMESGVRAQPGTKASSIQVFKRQLSEANRFAGKYYGLKEQTFTAAGLLSDTPSSMGANLSRLDDPAVTDQLRHMRNVIEAAPRNARQPLERQWNEIKASAVNNYFLRSPDDGFLLTQRLTELDNGAKNILFPGSKGKKELKALARAGNAYDELKTAGIYDAYQKEVQLGAMVKQMALNNDSAGIESLLKVVREQERTLPAGQQSSLRRMVRAGIMEAAVGSAVTREAGGELVAGAGLKVVENVPRIDVNSLRAFVSQLRRSGADRFLDPEDLQLLGDASIVQDLLRMRSDAGTSIQAAEQVARARGLLSGTTRKMIEVVAFLGEHFAVSHFMVHPIGRRMLLGAQGIARRPTTAQGGAPPTSGFSQNNVLNYIVTHPMTAAKDFAAMAATSTGRAISQGAAAAGRTLENLDDVNAYAALAATMTLMTEDIGRNEIAITQLVNNANDIIINPISRFLPQGIPEGR
jgi:hypothetical protein